MKYSFQDTFLPHIKLVLSETKLPQLILSFENNLAILLTKVFTLTTIYQCIHKVLQHPSLLLHQKNTFVAV